MNSDQDKLSGLALLRFNRVTAVIISSQKAATFLMLGACIIGLTLAQTPLLGPINDFLHTHAELTFSNFHLEITVEHFISEGLLALFFFLIGLEIAREFSYGYLKDKMNVLFFMICAFFSIFIPILIFLAITRDPKGMYIPMATDIALAIAVLRVLKKKVGKASNVFLLTLSVLDDIFGIIVIAVFLSSGLNLFYLSGAILVVAILLVARRMKTHPISIGAILFIVLWVCLYKAGIHATIAGAILGLLTPTSSSKDPEELEFEIQSDDEEQAETIKKTILEVKKSVSLGDWLELHILPWVNTLVLPLFVFVNSLIKIELSLLSAVATSGISLGIIFGLTLGKTLGISLGNFVSIRLFKRLNKTPEIIFSFYEILMIGASAGIGFSVSVLLSTLIFEGKDLAVAKLAVLFGSFASALLAMLIYKFAPNKPAQIKAEHLDTKIDSV
jgi:NhaA family Na+:H+ antiporter